MGAGSWQIFMNFFPNPLAVYMLHTRLCSNIHFSQEGWLPKWNDVKNKEMLLCPEILPSWFSVLLLLCNFFG